MVGITEYCIIWAVCSMPVSECSQDGGVLHNACHLKCVAFADQSAVIILWQSG